MTGYESKRAAAQDKLAQEPVAYLCKPDQHGLFDPPTPDKACEDCFPVYAAPPQRHWVGLTDEEIMDVFKEKDALKFAQAIEEALRIKNT